MSFLYAAALLISIGGMVALDRSHRLFFFHDARRAAAVLAVGVVVLLVWDLIGVGLGMFFRGQSPYMTGWLLAPHLPVEEIGFLTLLSYLTMNVYLGAARRLAARAARRRPAVETPGGALR